VTVPGRFAGRVSLVTGGATGLGEGIARRLAAEGATLVISGRRESELRRAADDFRAAGQGAVPLAFDVTDEAAVAAALRRIVLAHGRLDIVVHGAGHVGPTHVPTADYPTEAFRDAVTTHLLGSFLMAKHALPYLERAPAGRLLFLASMAGRDGNPGMMGYTAAKAGLAGLIKAWGREAAGTRVTVNGLAPAVIRTPLVDAMAPEQVAYLTRLIPMRRPGTIEEVAALAAWIVSPEASFTTGFVFDLSGGRATY
jgi:3-oxoacyl-[acyl-carrier protein] reductase